MPKFSERLAPALALIVEFEGFRSKAYRDPIGLPTIGYGTTVYPDGRKVRMGDVVSKEAAMSYALHDITTERIPGIQRIIKVPLHDNELCALISFCYNVGVSALKRSTLARKLNAGSPRVEVANEFLKWTRAGGRVLAGLVRRRKAERALFLDTAELKSVA
jgi:lysozyme